MECALNLSWLAVVCLLLTSVVVAHRRKQLRLPLKLALGAAAVLALLLFPAISMTDDLQQATLLMEWPANHTASSIDAAAHVLDLVVLASPAPLLYLLLLSFASALLVLLARLLDVRERVKTRVRQQPYGVRPPPFLLGSVAA